MRIMTNADGYEYCIGDDGEMVPMHRLVAVVNHGVDALTGAIDVHHRELFDGGSIPWFNTTTAVVPEAADSHRARTLIQNQPAVASD